MLHATHNCPPKSHTDTGVPSISIVSTPNPIVGMVVITSPYFNCPKIVVLPALSSPSIRIRGILCLPQHFPMMDQTLCD